MKHTILVIIALSAGALLLMSQSPAGAMEPDAAQTPTGSATRHLAQQSDDDEPDVLLLALLTVGAAAGAAVVSLIGYVIRQRVGFWLHRPPPRDSSQPEDHH